MNAKEQMDLLRDKIGEASASHWSDLNLLRRLNGKQRLAGVKLGMTPGQWLIVSEDVTPSDSVITLPSDCAKPVYLEEKSSGRALHWLDSVTHRRVSRAVGTVWDTAGSREVYPLLGTIEVNQSSYSTECTLWYQIRVPDLLYGTCGASSGASAVHVEAAMFPVYLDDYYNGVTLEVVDNSSSAVDIRSTVTDYVASTGILTITGTAAENDVYASISRLPEEMHYLLVMEAAIDALSKPSSNIDKDVWKMIVDEVKDTRRDVQAWLESRIPGGGVVIGDPL